MAPILKKESRNNRNNYRTVSILPVVSKKFEKIMKKQLSKGFSTQYCLLLILEKWKNVVDNGKV